jgi:hypothetical protein
MLADPQAETIARVGNNEDANRIRRGDVRHCMPESNTDIDTPPTAAADVPTAGETADGPALPATPPPPPVIIHERRAVRTQTGIIIDQPEQERVALTGSVDIVVERSNQIISSTSPEYWMYAYPDLFPYGRGSLSEKRETKITLERWILRCLKLSTLQFAKHKSFAMMAFDILSRKRGMSSVYVKAQLNPQQVASFASITRDDLELQMNYDRQCRQADHSQVPRLPPPDSCKAAYSLGQHIDVGMRAMWGTANERQLERRRLTAMDMAFGCAAIFFTIAPDTANTLKVMDIGSNGVPFSDNEIYEALRTANEDVLSKVRVVCL